MPFTLLAAICSPLPEPPMTMPRLPGIGDDASAAPQAERRGSRPGRRRRTRRGRRARGPWSAEPVDEVLLELEAGVVGAEVDAHGAHAASPDGQSRWTARRGTGFLEAWPKQPPEIRVERATDARALPRHRQAGLVRQRQQRPARAPAARRPRGPALRGRGRRLGRRPGDVPRHLRRPPDAAVGPRRRRCRPRRAGGRPDLGGRPSRPPPPRPADRDDASTTSSRPGARACTSRRCTPASRASTAGTATGWPPSSWRWRSAAARRSPHLTSRTRPAASRPGSRRSPTRA